jgi:nitrogen fixation protein NifZ
MSDSAAPRFQWGQPVLAATDLFNDGSYPEAPVDALLVAAGERGEVVQIGAHVESRTNVYLVEFADRRVIGCFEAEILPLPAPAQESPPA